MTEKKERREKGWERNKDLKEKKGKKEMLREQTEEQFAERAAGGGIVPVYREYLADMEFSVTDVRETDGGGTPIVP